VKRGESVLTIARKYGHHARAHHEAERMKKAVIFPGQSLVVSSKGGSATASRKARASQKKT